MLSGCGHGDAEPPAAPSSAGPVKKMTHADAQKLAAKYRDEAVTTMGGTLGAPAADNLLRCDTPHTFAASTGGDVPVTADQQAAVLQKLREHYTQAQYAVEPPSTDASDRGALNVVAPDRVTVTVTEDGTDALHVNVSTPCYDSDEGL
ncbi:hypothetical protein GCM10010170_102350 [Dactylosporangium salmoneum]|uniref:Lipoprotein n=1 Tax=Dactylosporangium salmoneum TaxID=53361 RepID=A0ABP5V1R9_9ACTN